MTDRAVPLIDLGLLGPEAVPDTDPTDAGRRPTSWTTVAVGLVAVAALLTTAVPARADHSLVGAFASVDVDDPVLVDAGTLYAVSGGGSRTRVAAHRLADGAVRWQASPMRRITIWPAGPVTLIAPRGCASLSSFSTVAVDAVTGARLWERPGVPVMSLAAVGLTVFRTPLVSCAEANLGTDPNPAYAFEWSGVSSATGEVAWRRTVPAGVRLAVGVDEAAATGWLTITDDTGVTGYDLRTGRMVGMLPGTGPAPAASRTRMLGTGGTALLLRRTGAVLSVTAYDPVGFTELWRVGIEAPGYRFDLLAYSASRCGPALCLGPPSDTVALDPLTGTERWRRSGRPVRVGSGMAVFLQPGPRVGLDPPRLVAVDVVTGAEHASVRGWLPVGHSPDGVLITHAAASAELWQLSVVTGRLDKVARLDRRYDECTLAGGYLACRTPSAELTVWRLKEPDDRP